MSRLISSFTGPFAFLSPDYPCRVAYEGIVFPSVTHALEAAKTYDLRMRRLVAKAGTVDEARRRGRRLPLPPLWYDSSVRVMDELQREKFRVRELRELLLATGDARLVYGNLRGDRFWGVDAQGHGRNELGKMLELVRGDLREIYCRGAT